MARKKRKSNPPGNPEAEVATVIEEEEPNEFEAILDLDPNGLLVVEGETRQILWANRASERLLKKKRDKLFSEPFPEELEEGPMRTLDLNKKVHNLVWQGQECAVLTLSPLSTGGASFALEWRLEAAEERAREAEEQLAQLQAMPKGPVASDREEELQAELKRSLERIEGLELELRQFEQRAELAEERTREAESLMEEAESQAQETERSLEDLSDSVRKVEEDLESTRQQLQQESQRAQQLQSELEQARSQAQDDSALQLELESLREQTQLLQLEIDELLQRMAEQEQQALEASGEAGELEQSLRQKLAEAEEQKQAWAQRESEVEELEAVHMQVLTELEELRVERQSWEEQSATASDASLQMEALQQQLRDAQERNDFLDIEKAELEEKWQEARSELESLQHRSGEDQVALQEQLEQLQQASVEQLAELRHKLEEERADLNQRLEQAQSNSNSLEEQLLELQGMLEDEHRQKDELEQQSRQWLEEKAQLQKQIESLTSGQGELGQLMADLEDLQQHLVAVEKERDDLLRRLDQAEEVQEADRQKISEFEKHASEKDAEVEALTGALADLEAQLNQAQDELEQAKQASGASLQELQADRAQVEAQVAELRSQLEQSQGQLAESQALFEEATTESTQIQERMAEVEASATQLQQQLDSAQSDAEQARTQVDELLAQVQQAEVELAETQGKLSLLKSEQASSEELASQRDELQGRLAEFERQNVLLQEQLEELLEQMDQASQWELEAARLRDELSQAQLLLVPVTPPVVGLDDAEKAAFEGEIQRVQEELELTQSQLQETQAQLQETQAQLEEAHAHVLDGGIPSSAQVPFDSGSLEEDPRVAELQAELETLKAKVALEGEFAPVVAAGEATMAPSPANETEQLAFEDNLTHLPNLNLLRRYLDFSLKQVDRYQRRCVLIHIDLDRFQALNEALGNEAGDDVLRQVAERLQKVVRTSDVLCRKGEDDFLILLSEVAGEADSTESISIVLKRIQEMLAPPINAGHQPVLVSASIGVSQFPSDAKDPEEMLEHAAKAMRRAKELGRNQVQFYTEDLQKRHEARNLLESELRKAVEARQFQLLYQPIVHLPTGRVAGVESLLRWHHPEYGVQTPDSFLDVAEDSGLLIPIGRWVILQAAQQLYDWARQGLDMFVTVNLSPRQFLQADLVETIRRALEATGAPAHNFVVEIPESVQMLDIQRVQSILLALRQAGVRVALDRFGSGFSSLERLHAELITLLKIDRKFLFHAATNAAALNVTVAALGVARGLRLRPVAVGVENESQLSLCRQLECEYVQGNLVYVPTDAAQVSELARAGRLLR